MKPEIQPTSYPGGSSDIRQFPSPPIPGRGRIVLPFENRPADIGAWTYEHKVGLCVMIIAYLILGIVFVSVKLAIGAPPQEHTVYVDLTATTPEELIQKQLTPQERRQMEADLSNARNEISNENAEKESSRQNERTGGGDGGGGGSRGGASGSPIPQSIADEADAVAGRMRASRDAYERGLREEQAMIDAHNASKRSKEGTGQKQEDVKVAGNVLISFSLAGRTFTYMHKPSYQCEGSGQVVVAIAVNRNGKVTSASVQGASSQEECLIERALEAARLSTFNVDGSAPASQNGTITYAFVRQ